MGEEKGERNLEEKKPVNLTELAENYLIFGIEDFVICVIAILRVI